MCAVTINILYSLMLLCSVFDMGNLSPKNETEEVLDYYTESS